MLFVTSLALDMINPLIMKLLGVEVCTLVRYRLHVRLGGFVVGFTFSFVCWFFFNFSNSNTKASVRTVFVLYRITLTVILAVGCHLVLQS